MTGLEPHPIVPTLTQEMALGGGEEWVYQFRSRRAEAITKMQDDPLVHGWAPAIWNLVDDLLTEGKRVCLVDYPGLVPEEMIKTAARHGNKLEIMGEREILITGSNRSSKSEYAAQKIVRILSAAPERRTWCFADSEEVSISRQHPVVFKYLPAVVKKSMGREGKIKDINTRIGYSPNGFVGNKFSLPNRSQNWFKNYKQNPADMEGDQLDAIWLDELRNPELLKTLRVRLGDRGGLMIVTFTSIDDNYTAIVDEYSEGEKRVLEVDAELLPEKDAHGQNVPGRFEQVPRVCVAGPGGDGDQRANIVYFHITDNPFYGYTAVNPKAQKADGSVPVFGKERWYKNFRNANRAKILSRVYGILVRQRVQQFNFKRSVHVISREQVAKLMLAHPKAPRYHVVDPCSGRNWFMCWSFHWAPGKVLIYREWPSYGHPGAYIPTIGDPGPWTTLGAAYDGKRGPGQSPFRWGYDDYKTEIYRLEGRGGGEKSEVRSEKSEVRSEKSVLTSEAKPWMRNPLKPRVIEKQEGEEAGEPITERWIDARYANAAKQEREGSITMIEELQEIGLEFLAMSVEQGKILNNDDGSIVKINGALKYDPEVPIGKFSPALARINEPDLLISEDCPNMIYALERWTGLDGQKGACKDPVDLLRGIFLSELDFVGQDAYTWRGGGVAA